MARAGATVIGAADEELACLVKSGEPEPWHHAFSEDELLDAAFERLDAEAREQQEAVAKGRMRDTSAKRNRRDTYLNPKVRRCWVDRSRKFLHRQRAAVKDVSLSVLYSTVILQHLLELDVEDQSLPAEERRFENACTDGISNQFLLDARRGRYTVEGEVFHYADTSDDVAQSVFVEQFVAAIRRVTPPVLTAQTSGLMCQSSMAALERATLCAAAMCGGKQDVDYTLQRDPARPNERVLVSMQVHRHGFREYFTGIDAESDEGPRSSDKSSSVLKSATVAVDIGGLLDVVELCEQVNIVENGEPVPLDRLCKPIAKVPSRSVGEISHGRCGLRRAFACLEGCIRRCQRQAEQAREPDIQAAARAGVE